MKTISSDPVEWSRNWAGPKSFGLAVGFHFIASLLFGLAMLWILPERMRIFIIPIMLYSFIFAVFFPFVYLYALRRLLAIIDQEDSERKL